MDDRLLTTHCLEKQIRVLISDLPNNFFSISSEVLAKIL
jgi:hypothetical protein